MNQNILLKSIREQNFCQKKENEEELKQEKDLHQKFE